jgi:hypothetical protein
MIDLKIFEIQHRFCLPSQPRSFFQVAQSRLFRRITMKNQQFKTALLAIVLHILGACSNPATLETTAQPSSAGLRSQAVANIVPNAVWDATHVFNLGLYYHDASTFATNLNGVGISVQYSDYAVFSSQKLQFTPGKQANTLVSSEFSYTVNARAKISGLRNCTYSLGPQGFSVPAESITLTFDPTYTPDQYGYVGYDYSLTIVQKDWIHFTANSTVEVVSIDATLKSVCEGTYRGQTTTTYTPVTLFRTAQPYNPTIHWSNQISISNEFTDPNLLDIRFGTFPSGGAHLWR